MTGLISKRFNDAPEPESKYDIIFVLGESFFDHPLCGAAILKRWLEKNGFSVGIIDCVKTPGDVLRLGRPRLFFGVSSGSMDSMVLNYTPLKKPRADDKHIEFGFEPVPDRAVIVYCNWIKEKFKGVKIVLGGTEASLRRFSHYDYWENRIRKPILFDAKADLLSYGNSEKQVVEIAERIRKGSSLQGIPGSCIIAKDIPPDFKELPSYEEALSSKEEFCKMQNLFSNDKNLAQKIDNRYLLQYKSPHYTPKDLDEYYSLPFTREVPKRLRGFQFSVVTHRGCIGNCNFCSLNLTQGPRIISRSEESILAEIRAITKHTHFRGNIDDLGGPSANMYGMDCSLCKKNKCLNCSRLDRSNRRLIALLRKARSIPGVKNVFIKSGIRYDLASKEYLKEIAFHHIFDTLRIAPEHVNKKMLRLMNKDYGNLNLFIKEFESLKSGKELSFYFIAAHPGSGKKEAEELAKAIRSLKNAESFQLFTPTPMTVSTCMYYAGLDPKTGEKIEVPYNFSEKKIHKRMILGLGLN